MEKIAIITDSCSDIKKEYRELYDIHVYIHLLLLNR
jgi:fatty acid-binding protein DegV